MTEDEQALDVFAATARARHAFADLIAGLTPTQLDTPSLCSGWAVRTVAGHLLAATDPSLGRLLLATLRHGGLHRANDALARRGATRAPAPPSWPPACTRAPTPGQRHR